MKRPTFANGEIYHVYNRGVEKREVFMENKDYFRFIHDLYEFNDTRPAPASNTRFSIDRPSQLNAADIQQSLEVGHPKFGTRKLLVHLLAFCLMPNHYHLLVRQINEGGVSKFMQKIGTGYTNYFNEKNKRVGPLFQGKFKAVHIATEAHFIHIPHYIHLNPLDLIEPAWRDSILKNSPRAMKYLQAYRWSSFPDYIGERNFPSVTQREFLLDFFKSSAAYKRNTWRVLREMTIEDLADLIIE
ncbi:MAG: transposase [Candidatus Andersenbacteria bacterium]|nr:transposase [Candidatus Andersenbacteria bacterium]